MNNLSEMSFIRGFYYREIHDEKEDYVEIVDTDDNLASASSIVFPSKIGGKKLKSINLRESEKVFAAKALRFPACLEHFYARNKQLPNVVDVIQSTTASCAPQFFFSEKTLFRKSSNSIYSRNMCIINVFDITSTGSYVSQNNVGKGYVSEVAPYAFEDTRFSNVVLNRFASPAREAFDGSRFKELQKDKPLFLVGRLGSSDILMDVNQPDAPIDIAKFSDMIMFDKKSSINKEPFSLTLLVGGASPKSSNAFARQEIRKSVKRIVFGKGFRMTNKMAREIAGFGNVNEVVVENNDRYVIEDGVLFSKDKKTLMFYPPKRKGETYAVPSGTERIFEFAFHTPTYLIEKLSFPDSCKLFDTYSLYGLRLEELRIPKQMLNANKDCFYACLIKNFIVPGDVKVFTISGAAFQYLNAEFEEGIEYLGKNTLNVSCPSEFSGIISDDEIESLKTKPVVFNIPESVISISGQAVYYRRSNEEDCPDCVFKINAYSKTSNLVIASYNALKSCPYSTAYALVNVVDRDMTVPVSAFMKADDADTLNAAVDESEDYDTILSIAFAAIKSGPQKAEIALMLYPESSGKVRTVLEKVIKGASNTYVKHCLDGNDAKGLLQVMRTGLCSQKTLEDILTSPRSKNMAEVIAIATEKTKKRKVGLSI